LFCKFYAKNVKSKIENNKYDIIYAPVSSTLIAFLNVSIPIVYFSDATFQLLVDYYPEFTGLSKKNIRDGNNIDKRALNKVSQAIFCSDWAIKSAVDYYKLPAEKAFRFELGANLLYEPQPEELDFSDSAVCNILFLGVDWSRKGGEIAYKTYLKLKSDGFPCTFTVIGCAPDIGTEGAPVTIIPFINKNDTTEFRQLYNILLKTHILLLPSRAECCGAVFSEASAFGIVSIATNTGGIPSSVQEGVNGFLLDMKAGEQDYANKISTIFYDREFFRKLRTSSRSVFETKLSWKIWTEKFNKYIKSN
jgi:glycosyltransferase involved in cell wall biosynthesis